MRKGTRNSVIAAIAIAIAAAVYAGFRARLDRPLPASSGTAPAAPAAPATVLRGGELVASSREQRLDPARLDHFLQLLELPKRMHGPLRRIVERETSSR